MRRPLGLAAWRVEANARDVGESTALQNGPTPVHCRIFPVCPSAPSRRIRIFRGSGPSQPASGATNCRIVPDPERSVSGRGDAAGGL